MRVCAFPCPDYTEFHFLPSWHFPFLPGPQILNLLLVSLRYQLQQEDRLSSNKNTLLLNNTRILIPILPPLAGNSCAISYPLLLRRARQAFRGCLRPIGLQVSQEGTRFVLGRDRVQTRFDQSGASLASWPKRQAAWIGQKP